MVLMIGGALLCSSQVQDEATLKSSLEELIRALHKGMRSGNREEQLKVLRSTYPTRKDLEKLFPKAADKLQGQLEAGVKDLEANLDKVAKEFIRGGEIKQIELTDIRTAKSDGDYKDVLDMMPKDVPAFDFVVRYESRTAGGGTYLLVNDHWIYIHGLASLPKVLEKLK